MSKNVRIVINKPGIHELLRSPSVLADLRRRATAIAAKAGPGHEVTVHVGPNRVRANVITATWEARIAEAKHRSLTAAIDAGRL